jgi:hypothetical protein
MMKRILLPLILLTLFTSVTIAQNESTESFGLGVRWGFMVIKPPDAPGGFPTIYGGKQVDATVMYKDSAGTVLYTEDHSGTLDDFSQLAFTIGRGDNPTPQERLPSAAYRKVAKLCYTMTVHADEGPVVFEDMQDVSSVPKANFAFHAENADRIGNAVWSNQPLTLEKLETWTSAENFGFLIWKQEESEVDTILPLEHFIFPDTSIAELSGEEENVIRFGDGSGTPLIFGPSTPTTFNSIYTICIPPLVNAKHGAEFKVGPHPPPGSHSPSKTHTTAAVYADNTESPLSAGVLANAQTWGLYGTGQNGTVGISNGAGSGAAIWGSVAQAPEAGGFKYALYGNSQSFTGAWSAAIFGNGFYTGTWSMSSDARLKTEVREQTNALDKIMQLRPAQYRYRQDTPYSLPDGIHHGFLAQEMEKVFPELVSDITMPLDPDPQKMHSSETTQYKAINYIEIIAILTGAMQELNRELDTQKAEIAELRKAIQNANEQK